MKRLFAISGLFMALTTLANAATRTAASSSFVDVSVTVLASARGDTVLVPSGASTWPITLTLTKGITLRGAGRANTVITCSGKAVSISPDATALASGELFRVEGFTFDGNNSPLVFLEINGASAGASKPFTNMAVGNCTFRNASTTTSGSGAISTKKQVRGVIYSNIFDRCNVILKVMGNNDSGEEWANGHWPRVYGTADSLFFENNTIMYSSSYSGQDSGWTESGQGGRLVMRYNSWNMANGHHTELWDVHGFQNFPGNGQTGTMISEYYGNTVAGITAGRWLTHRGGWGLFFNNIVTGSGGAAIEINQYAAGDAGGSGCTADVPGASGVYVTEITNTYVFNNTVNGSIKNMAPGPIGDGCGTAQNSHWYNYNSSFNGTVGIGRGTSAPTGSATKGVGYWMASTATPTTNASVIQAGHLYLATATGTWTDYYTPYTYPHPLTGGSSIGGSTNPVISVTPASPTFGSVAIGSINDLTLTVQNVGGGTLAGTASVAAPLSIVGSSTYSLASNATQVITVRYIPIQVGNISQMVTFTGGGGASALLVGGTPMTYIWALGDSNTQGNAVPGGYRLPLYQLLTNAGVNATFVGNANDNPASGLPYPNHDGYGGYEIGNIANNVPTWLSGIHAPDFVLLMIGLNDFRHNNDIQNAPNRLENLIIEIAANAPSARIIVADLNPWTNLMATNNAMDVYYNPYIPGVVARQAALGRKVYLCDMRGKLSAADLTSDNTHFNQTGHNKIGSNWFGIMSALISPLGQNKPLPPAKLIVVAPGL